MRIGVLAPIAWRTPPRAYGPWERVASLVTEGLVARGHDVLLFATGDSVTGATLVPVAPHGYAEDPGMDGRVWEAMHVAAAMARSGELDIVHSHLDWLPLAFAASWRAPLVTTVHGFSGPAILPAYRAGGSALVSISDADRDPGLDYVATVHHGVDMTEFTATVHAGDYLATLGRIHPDKGVHDAITIAAAAGRRLVICGPVVDQAYFDTQLRPHIDGDRVVHLGSVGAEQRSRVIGGAAALLHPIHFAEPFGLAVVEAMACGTPVIAYRRGAMPELVEDGVTGALVDDRSGAISAVEAVVALDRRRVRAEAERRFGVDRMVDEYVAVYERVIGAYEGRRGGGNDGNRTRVISLED